jgi:hypothetical protein
MMSDVPAAEHVPRRIKKYWVVCGGVALIVAALLAAIWAWHPWSHANNAALPPAITAQIKTFTPYEPLLLPAGLSLDKSSASFDGNALIFRLSKTGGTMVVTEQNSPPKLADGKYDSEKVDGVDGVAYISRDHTRTFATFFANGRGGKPTMILINTSDPFTSDDFKDLLRGFRVAL